MPHLSEKDAIITDAGREIGRAIALTFAREGASVIIADYRSDLVQNVVEAIANAGGQAIAIQTDVSNENSVASMAHPNQL